MGVFKKGKNNSNLDKKIARLDEDLKRTGVVRNNGAGSLSEKTNKNDDVQMITEHVKSDWRSGYKKEEISKEDILQEEIEAVRNKKNSLRKVDGYISSIDENYTQLKNDIFQELSEDFLHNIPALESKINHVLEIYNHIEEGLLNQPPETPTEDPLTPLDQQFITAEDLDAHYKLFINRIQEQIATIGGGGEVRLKWLDDIVGIATNASAYDGQFLKYDHSIEKFVFATVVGGGGTATQGTQGIQGTAGSAASQGTQGIQGNDGNFGGATFDYTFSTSTALSDPGTGILKFSESPFSGALNLYIDNEDDNGTDISSFLATIDDSTSTIKGHFRVSNRLNADDFALFTISSITDRSGYYDVSCSYVSGSATSFSDTEDVIITFCLLYTSPSPRDLSTSRMPSSA